MTDRYKGFIITLEKNLRDDDAQGLIEAIGLMKGVIGVKPVLAKGLDDHIIHERIKYQIWAEVRKIILGEES